RNSTDLGGNAGHNICHLLGLAHPAAVARLTKVCPKGVHAHFGTSAVDVWPVARRAGLPILVTLHGYDISISRDWWEEGNSGLRRRSYPSSLLAMAKHPNVNFIAVSNAIMRRAVNFGIPSEKVHVRYIGVDTDKFTPGSV